MMGSICCLRDACVMNGGGFGPCEHDASDVPIAHLLEAMPPEASVAFDEALQDEDFVFPGARDFHLVTLYIVSDSTIELSFTRWRSRATRDREWRLRWRWGKYSYLL